MLTLIIVVIFLGWSNKDLKEESIAHQQLSTFVKFFSKIVPTVESNEESRQLMRMTGQFNYLFQIHDSINDLFTVKKVMRENYIELKSDILLPVREISGLSLTMFDDVQDALEGEGQDDLARSSDALQASLDRTNRELLALMGDPTRRDVSALINFVTYSRRMGDKLLNFSKLEQKGNG